jgi:hypothetical protein
MKENGASQVTTEAPSGQLAGGIGRHLVADSGLKQPTGFLAAANL